LDSETSKGNNKIYNTHSTGQPKSDQNKNKIDSMPNYLEKDNTIQKYEIISNDIVKYIEFMREHAFIGKFMGIWPTNKFLKLWIKVEIEAKMID
jgi:hypothetical protein